MKLLASYNVFSGLELLEPSILSIRDCVDHVNLVIQNTSNLGNKSDEPFKEAQRLRLKGLVNSIIIYVPDTSAAPKANETRKRNLGLDYARKQGYDYFITLDTDELYESDQFNESFEKIIKGNYDSSACKMQTYYKTPEYRLKPPEEYYVPFISKVDERSFINGIIWPIHADPSRKMKTKKLKVFQRDELEMHHYSYVRKDIRNKLYNASSSVNFKFRLEEIAIHHDNWEYPQKAYLGGSKKRLMTVEKVEDKFKGLWRS